MASATSNENNAIKILWGWQFLHEERVQSKLEFSVEYTSNCSKESKYEGVTFMYLAQDRNKMAGLWMRMWAY